MNISRRETEMGGAKLGAFNVERWETATKMIHVMPFPGAQAHTWATGKNIHCFKSLSLFWETLMKTNRPPPIKFCSPHACHIEQDFVLFNGKAAEKELSQSVFLGIKNVLNDDKMGSPHVGKTRLVGGACRDFGFVGGQSYNRDNSELGHAMPAMKPQTRDQRIQAGFLQLTEFAKSKSPPLETKTIVL